MISRGLLVTWDVVTDDNSCARSSIIHNVMVVRAADGTIIVSVDDIVDTQIEITDSSLEPRQNYSIHIGTRVLQGTCETGEVANIVCKMSDDLSPTTTPPGTCTLLWHCVLTSLEHTELYSIVCSLSHCWPARLAPWPSPKIIWRGTRV